jgi:hypothetical protein
MKGLSDPAMLDIRKAAVRGLKGADYLDKTVDANNPPKAAETRDAVTFTGQAQQVAAVSMRDARQGLRVSLLCNMRAFPVEVFDTLYVTLPRFGW